MGRAQGVEMVLPRCLLMDGFGSLCLPALAMLCWPPERGVLMTEITVQASRWSRMMVFWCGRVKGYGEEFCSCFTKGEDGGDLVGCGRHDLE